MSKKLGVVIGRFQVPELHAGHRHVLDTANAENDDLLVLLGVNRIPPSKKNPLPAAVRAKMLRDAYPAATVLETRDQPSNARWSEDIDSMIRKRFSGHEAVLYGSRDSFIPFYEGQLKTRYVEPVPAPSGTDLRACIREEDHSGQDFRLGMICGQALREPISYQAVDLAIVNSAEHTILVERKNGDEGRFRFVGGFVQPGDGSLEEAALRELREEAGDIVCAVPCYLGSFRIPDYRYRGEEDTLLSAFFVAEYVSGTPEAGDGIDGLAWIPIRNLPERLIPIHLPLAGRLLAGSGHERTKK